MEYHHREIEKKWQKYWEDNQVFKTDIDNNKPKYYVLDMFPYPSGAGLHVGHPLGYIASDIFSRYKKLKGFNVLHPMGFDAFGLPAEQYAIQTGQHPEITTMQNIKRYKEQLAKIGFSFDWTREVLTCAPEYYKWTQWVFLKMFDSWYNKQTDKAEPLQNLISIFEKNGNHEVNAHHGCKIKFSAEQWKNFNEKQQQEILLDYRLAYLSNTMVNWCPQLGTVLANDEVKDGFSERGGFPVVRKEMKQWALRITAYNERLLNDLDELDWSDSLKEVQRNWIGKSQGAIIDFNIENNNNILKVFTTRPDTIFGVGFMVVAPEHQLVLEITTKEQKEKVLEYIEFTKNKTERERQSEVKNISGVFTGAYVIHPFSGEKIQIWISEYVLGGYGTGAIMAVPAHDSRDYAFAKHFNLPIKEVVAGGDISIEAYETKEGTIINSDFINGLKVKDAISKILQKVEEKKIGFAQINYRLRDAIFSRQRYWGEPFPIYFKDEMPYPIDLDKLPLELPEVDAYLPTDRGEPPLARAKNWKYKNEFHFEASTMPGFAGSSAYYLRYMDPKNGKQLVSKEANEYWKNVDLYIGGAEHATGHLIYSRFWNKFLFDYGLVCEKEPFKKLINQGMIQGVSSFVYRINNTNIFVSKNKLRPDMEYSALHVDVSFVKNNILNIEEFKKWRPEFTNAQFPVEYLEDNENYICGSEVEKMSKSKYNVVNPDELIDKYGADTFRLYEMFLGPIEMHKPWDTNGIEGVARFIRKYWRLFHNETGFDISDEKPNSKELKILHKTIKKITEDIEKLSLNTSVSSFMICVNELTDLKCNKREILMALNTLLSPFAPYITEELWHKDGNNDSITKANYPEFNSNYLVENTFVYPVSFNGKLKFKLEIPNEMSEQEINKILIENEEFIKHLADKVTKKIIIVKGKIINIVI
ncbi:MAG: leucine--tRNA ligase [Bacteroidetes bacterium GWE2_29_8]|nr:MAG: leucine--tRNA ligase [Bacteroidetes bacterium GWE2_29_8]OFY23961.1 MAG: leucine--tRNA ligase [Bacteroidetes bacterium GWF2_29_10]